MCLHWPHQPLTTKRLSSIVPHMALPAQASPARQVEVVYGSGPATHPAGPPTISIVVPAFNEEAGLGPTLAALRASMPKSVIEVIVVDDGSTDRTAAVAAEAGFRVVRHPNNRAMALPSRPVSARRPATTSSRWTRTGNTGWRTWPVCAMR